MICVRLTKSFIDFCKSVGEYDVDMPHAIGLLKDFNRQMAEIDWGISLIGYKFVHVSNIILFESDRFQNLIEEGFFEE